MARSKTDIANMALGLIGDIQIVDIDDPDNTAARITNKFYDISIDSLSEMHDWTFLTKLVKPQRVSEQPLFDFNYSYRKPLDFLRMVDIGNRSHSVLVSGEYIYSNDSDLAISYIVKDDDPNVLSAVFVKSLVHYLASVLAVPMKASIQVSQYLEQKALSYCQQAVSVDDKNFSEYKELRNLATYGRWFSDVSVNHDKDLRPFDRIVD